MAKPRKILAHARSVASIRTVTRSMEMVSTVRFKRVHEQVVASRPYVRHVAEMVGDLVDRAKPGELDHPMLTGPEGVKSVILLVLVSERGLCGAYNAAVGRIAAQRRRSLVDAGWDCRVQVVGRRGVRAVRSRGLEIERVRDPLPYPPAYHDASRLAGEFSEEFVGGQVGGLEVAYMQFVSAGRQHAAIAPLLPLSEFEPPERFIPSGREPLGYDLMPDRAALLDRLLPMAFRLRLFQCFLDAAASEQVMRMRAMRSASDNAEEMIHNLTVRYNRARQSQITTELAEIMGGREGVA